MLGLSRSGLPVLRDVIHERTGLFYDETRFDMLGERVAPLVVERGFRSFLDLYYLLKYDAPGVDEVWKQVMDALSVQETYLWREMDQIRAIVCRVVPELVRRNRGVIRIWSAPCATGEEPLTIAMALEEAGWFERAAIEIHASDGSVSAIAKARAARYRGRSFRALPPGLKGEVLPRRWRRLHAHPRAVRSNQLVERRQPHGLQRDGPVSARARSSFVEMRSSISRRRV